MLNTPADSARRPVVCRNDLEAAAYSVLVLDQKNNCHDFPLCADKIGDAKFPTIVAHRNMEW